MYHNTKLADKMLTELSEFLRYSLRFDPFVFVSLKNEIEIIEKYLLIEKIRFGDNLDYRFEISPGTYELKVLCFMLQPLVENAIKHGMRSSTHALTIIISSQITEGWLNLEIKNTGKLDKEQISEGTGLSNIKERLINAYPNNHSFDISENNGWIKVIIKIRCKS